jgi:hexosaminidase
LRPTGGAGREEKVSSHLFRDARRSRARASVLRRRLLACTGFALIGILLSPVNTASSAERAARANTFDQLVPKPQRVVKGRGVFMLQPSAELVVTPFARAPAAVAATLGDALRRATGFALPVVRTAAPPPAGSIALRLGGATSLGAEGYELTVSPSRVTLVARRPAGLFYATKTLQQLLPAAAARATVQPGPWLVPVGTVRDAPRFRWRGAMLDVARHFFGADDVEHLIDAMAAYKLNRLHLHLSDDQGWRLQIRARPRLTAHGAKTAVGGGPGGFYTQREYRQLVAYAQRRFVTVVPEVDMPGHSTAALSSYPSLTCSGQAPPVYTGVGITASSLCVRKASTYSFVNAVLREIAALTPGPYVHIGGDEAAATAPSDYVRFVERVQAIAARYGKRVIGWEEIGRADLRRGTVVQHWHGNGAAAASRRGAKVIMSPAEHAYLDQKYKASTKLGLTWAGYVSVEDAYRWDPATVLPGVAERNVLGVEAPLWTETVASRAAMDYMLFPRLIGIAEIAWSPKSGRSWSEYRVRLGAQADRLAALGIAFYRSPEVPWR